MKHEIRKVTKNVLQITTQDERHYHDIDANIYMPSITWVTGHYPKGKEFYKWLASIGWNEAEALKTEAGDKGTRQHAACELLLNGKTISYNSKFWSKLTRTEEELTTQEYEGVLSFANWFNATQPEVLHVEESVFHYPDEQFSHGFAGSVDLICRINGQLWIIDLKTSKNVFESHKIQLSAYKHIVQKKYPGEDIKIAVLQIGFAKNKKHWKFTECEDKFHLFQVAYRIWQEEVKYKDVLQKDLPLKIKLENPKESPEVKLYDRCSEVEIVIPKKKLKALKKKLITETKLK